MKARMLVIVLLRSGVRDLSGALTELEDRL